MDILLLCFCIRILNLVSIFHYFLIFCSFVIFNSLPFPVFFFSLFVHKGGTHLPSLTSSINARPACFCREFCHSCEHSSMTSSTTDVLCFIVTSPTKRKKNSITTFRLLSNSFFLHDSLKSLTVDFTLTVYPGMM